MSNAPFRKGSIIQGGNSIFIAIGEPYKGSMNDYYIRSRCLITGKVYDVADYYTTLTY